MATRPRREIRSFSRLFFPGRISTTAGTTVARVHIPATCTYAPAEFKDRYVSRQTRLAAKLLGELPAEATMFVLLLAGNFPFFSFFSSLSLFSPLFFSTPFFRNLKRRDTDVGAACSINVHVRAPIYSRLSHPRQSSPPRLVADFLPLSLSSRIVAAISQIRGKGFGKDRETERGRVELSIEALSGPLFVPGDTASARFSAETALNVARVGSRVIALRSSLNAYNGLVRVRRLIYGSGFFCLIN